MTAPALLCATVEIALDRYLGLEPRALEACAGMSGRVIALQAASAPLSDWTLYVEFHAGGVRVLPELEREPDVRVRGAPAALLRLGLNAVREDVDGGIPHGLEVEGDVELLRRFNRILADVGFDPEELTSRLVGDEAAHRATAGLRTLFGWTRRAVSTLGLDTAEYLREETRDLARAADVDEWVESVERLRDDVARFEARLDRLEARGPR